MRSHKEKGWITVPDSQVRHRWDLTDSCMEECGERTPKSVFVHPGFYEDSGTPICEACGNDRIFESTEVLVNATAAGIAIQQIYDLLYLDFTANNRTMFYNANKVWNSDVLQAISEAVT